MRLNAEMSVTKIVHVPFSHKVPTGCQLCGWFIFNFRGATCDFQSWERVNATYVRHDALHTQSVSWSTTLYSSVARYVSVTENRMVYKPALGSAGIGLLLPYTCLTLVVCIGRIHHLEFPYLYGTHFARPYINSVSTRVHLYGLEGNPRQC